MIVHCTPGIDQGFDECEDCGRSIITRFGEALIPQFCDSCNHDFERLNAAGKIWVEDA